MQIIKDDLTIRNAKLEDAEILCHWWNNGDVMSHAGFPNGLNTNVDKIKGIISKNTDESRLLIIEYKNIPIGEMNYSGIDDTVEIGIKICNTDFQNQGLGTILLRMFITSLFKDYAYSKIILDTNLKNTRAQATYEKLGFRKMRVNEDSWKNQLGKLQSSVDYELKKTEWL